MSDTKLHATLLSLGDRPLVTAQGRFRAHVFRNLETRSFAVALVCGDPGGPEPLLARVHSSCVTSESWCGCDCDCALQLHQALRRIADAGRGVLFHLQQEGRGAGFTAKARDRMLVQESRHRLTTFEAYERLGLGSDHRRYDEVAAACRLLGVRAPLRLLTNNPEKRAALEAEKLAVEEVVALTSRPSPFNLHYLASKSRSGHVLAAPRGSDLPAELPEPVEAFAPHALPGAERFLRLASYLLPVRIESAGAPRWFRVHVHYDREEHRERVVLSVVGGPSRPASVAVAVHDDTLLDRFVVSGSGLARLAQQGSAAGRFAETARALLRHGRGHVAILPTRLDAEPAAADSAALALLGHHAGAGPVHVVAGREDERRRLAHGLAGLGLAAAPEP